MIDGKNFFDQPINNDKITYEKLLLVNEMITLLVVYQTMLKNYYKMIAIGLSQQQALDADPRAVQQINFTENLDIVGNTRIYFILEEVKETALDFSQGSVKVL